MFRDQFAEHLSPEDLEGLKQVCLFVIKHYLKAWFRCPIAAEAPFQDFNFMKTVSLDKALNKDLVPLIVEKMSRHLWYLQEETVGLAFFDDSIPTIIKDEMRERLRLGDEDWEEDETVAQNGHRVVDHPEVITKTYLTKKFSHFVNPNTMNFFTRFDIPTEFLFEPSSENWSSHPSYKVGYKIVEELKVTNDTAERSVQRMAEYVGIITKEDSEYQELVVLVDEYHKNYPTYLKRDLV